MALIKNYGIAGIAANVQLGLNGGYIDYAANTFTLLDNTSANADLVVGTLTFEDLNDGVINVTQFDDDGTMAANSSTRLATQAAIIEYVNNNSSGTLNFDADTGGVLSIDLPTETFSILGSNNIVTQGTNNSVIIDLAPELSVDELTANVLTFNQGLSDGTLTMVGFDNDPLLTANSASLVPTQQAVKLFVQNANLIFANIIDEIIGNSTLTYEPDIGGEQTVALGTEVFVIEGGTNITTTGVGTTLTIDLDNDIFVRDITATRSTVTNDLTVQDFVNVSGDVVIAGNLTVSGNTTTINVEDLKVTDSILHLAANNEQSDILDIGFIGHYSPDAGNTALHTGLVRDATDKKFVLFDSLDQPELDQANTTGTSIDFANASTATLVAEFEGNISGQDATFTGTIEFNDLSDGTDTVNAIITSSDGLSGNANDFTIPTSQAVADFVESKGDGLLVQQLFTATGSASEFAVGPIPNNLNRTYYVDKIMLNVTTPFSGDSFDHVLIKQGVTDLIEESDADAATQGVYHIGVSGVDEIPANGNLDVEFKQVDGTTPAIVTSGSMTVSVHYNWV